MPSPAEELDRIQQKIWEGSLPLTIRLSPSECRTYEKSDPYLIQYPRLSYLPFLLPRLKAFFKSFLIQPDVPAHEGWFSFEGVPLKWHYPLGLLYDLFSGADPTNSPKGLDNGSDGLLSWNLEVHFTEWPDEQLVRLDEEGRVMHDAFINSVKEADFTRNGTAKGIMSLSKSDSTALWHSVQTHDRTEFNSIHQKLLNPPGSSLRFIPLKVYLPSSPSENRPTSPTSETDGSTTASLRVVQAPITPSLSSREPQTLGTALNSLLPSLFPSRRTAILARPILHGAVVPMSANMENVMRAAAYSDGWVHLGVLMMV